MGSTLLCSGHTSLPRIPDRALKLAQYIDQMLAQHWTSVKDAGPVLSQHLSGFWCLFACLPEKCNAILADGGYVNHPRAVAIFLFIGLLEIFIFSEVNQSILK